MSTALGRCGKVVVNVSVGDICDYEGDAIVNPANTRGSMGGGVALAIKLRGGETIEKEAMAKAPIPVGEAVVTTAGNLRCKAVIHAPTVIKPGGPSSTELVYLATKASLIKAVEHGYKKIAFPLMGAGVGGLTARESLEWMFKAIGEFADRDIEITIFVRKKDLLYEVKEVFHNYCGEKV